LYAMSKRDWKLVDMQCNVVARGLRNAYWCLEIGENDLAKLSKYVKIHFGLEVSTKYPRLVYNPQSTTDDRVNAAMDRGDKEIGKLFGYPTPGQPWGQWWVSWQVRMAGRKDTEFETLFNFQMNKPQMKKLVQMKKTWNETMPTQYFDFEVRYRENSVWSDVQHQK